MQSARSRKIVGEGRTRDICVVARIQRHIEAHVGIRDPVVVGHERKLFEIEHRKIGAVAAEVAGVNQDWQHRIDYQLARMIVRRDPNCDVTPRDVVFDRAVLGQHESAVDRNSAAVGSLLIDDRLAIMTMPAAVVIEMLPFLSVVVLAAPSIENFIFACRPRVWRRCRIRAYRATGTDILTPGYTLAILTRGVTLIFGLRVKLALSPTR